jgi:hypothetical protein
MKISYLYVQGLYDMCILYLSISIYYVYDGLE